MRSVGVALDDDCREGRMFAFSAIRLKLAFSEISNSTFNDYYQEGKRLSTSIIHFFLNPNHLPCL